MSVYFLGAFPPPYGGVTRKNELLLRELSKHISISAVDFSMIKHGDLKESMHLARALRDPDARYVLGVSGRKTRRRFCSMLASVNPHAMSRSVLMLMGSNAADDIAGDAAYREAAGKFRRIYVETEGMRSILNDAGLTNAAVYPNPRAVPERKPKAAESSSGLRCVFFSQVSETKGADLVLQAAERSPDIVFDFFGPVDRAYEERFLSAIHRLDNAHYHGVFTGNEEALYETLQTYSVLLLPTRAAEGVPGALIEGKIAGLAEIVSDFRYAHDVVNNGTDGWVLPQCDAVSLSQAVRCLSKDRALLASMQAQSRESAGRYDIAQYIPGILEDLT